MKSKPPYGWKYLQIIFLTQNSFLEYIKNSQNSTIWEQTALQKCAKDWTDTSLKKIYGAKNMKRCSITLIMELQIKSTMKYCYMSIRMSIVKKKKWMVASNVGEHAELLKLSYVAGRIVKWYRHFKGSFAVSYKVKDTHIIWLSNPILRCLPKRIINLFN